MMKEWTLVSDDPILGKRVYRLDLDDNYAVHRTEYYRINELIDANAEDGAALRGQSWGDGQLVARIPVTKLFNPETGLIDALREGDDRYLNRWLNDGDNRAFRVKEGQV